MPLAPHLHRNNPAPPAYYMLTEAAAWTWKRVSPAPPSPDTWPGAAGREHSLALAGTNSQAHAGTRRHTYTYTHTPTHTPIHTHTHSHTHTHTYRAMSNASLYHDEEDLGAEVELGGLSVVTAAAGVHGAGPDTPTTPTVASMRAAAATAEHELGRCHDMHV